MTDYVVHATAYLARPYCPTCEAEIQHEANEILETRYCGIHQPSTEGVADAAVTYSDSYPAGSTEAGGSDNRRWCDLLHRGKRR